MPVLNVCWMSKHFVEVHVNYYGCAWLRLACAIYLAPRHYGSSLFSLIRDICRVFCEQILKEVPFVCCRLYQNKLSYIRGIEVMFCQ